MIMALIGFVCALVCCALFMYAWQLKRRRAVRRAQDGLMALTQFRTGDYVFDGRKARTVHVIDDNRRIVAQSVNGETMYFLFFPNEEPGLRVKRVSRQRALDLSNGAVWRE